MREFDQDDIHMPYTQMSIWVDYIPELTPEWDPDHINESDKAFKKYRRDLADRGVTIGWIP